MKHYLSWHYQFPDCEPGSTMVPLAEMTTELGSMYRTNPAENMYDNDPMTMAHTDDDSSNDNITITLKSSRIISSVKIMNRGDEYLKFFHMRLNNTKVELMGSSQLVVLCGYGYLKEFVISEVVTVKCDNLSFPSQSIIISADPDSPSLNIAELRACYHLLGKLTYGDFLDRRVTPGIPLYLDSNIVKKPN